MVNLPNYLLVILKESFKKTVSLQNLKHKITKKLPYIGL